MSGRARRKSRTALLLMMLAGPLSAGPARPSATAVEETPVGAEVGGGWFGRALCLGCAAAYVAAGGLTIGGTMIAISLYPEGAAACVYTCVRAF